MIIIPYRNTLGGAASTLIMLKKKKKFLTFSLILRTSEQVRALEEKKQKNLSSF